MSPEDDEKKIVEPKLITPISTNCDPRRGERGTCRVSPRHSCAFQLRTVNLFFERNKSVAETLYNALSRHKDKTRHSELITVACVFPLTRALPQRTKHGPLFDGNAHNFNGTAPQVIPQDRRIAGVQPGRGVVDRRQEAVAIRRTGTSSSNVRFLAESRSSEGRDARMLRSPYPGACRRGSGGGVATGATWPMNRHRPSHRRPSHSIRTYSGRRW